MMLKKILRYSLRTAIFIIAFIGIYLATAFCLSRITVHAEKNAPKEMAIYIKTNGVHTDIIVPSKNNYFDWTKQVAFSNTHLSGDTLSMQWLAFGWGDKGFYLNTPTWDDLTFSTAFKAAFALSTTAMHATYYSSITENKSCKKILISYAQYKRLVDYIGSSFSHDDAGNTIPIITNAKYNNADAFYEGTGRYSLFKTCNSWANAALKSCGQKACLWTAFDTGIFLKYE